MRHLTDDIVLSVKDAVRNLRYAIRSQAEASRPAGSIGTETQDRLRRAGRNRRRVAQLVDSVFTEVESGALALVSPGRDIGQGIRFPRPVTDYFARGRPGHDEAAERLCARTHYHAVKALLRGFGLRNVLVFEHAIGRARDTVLARQAGLVTCVRVGGSDSPRDDRVRLCAALSCALDAARPIKEIDGSETREALPQGLLATPNAYCFSVIGLATAIASVHEEAELPSAAEILESANAVVDVRFGRFAASFEADDPVEALAFEFNEVLPLLP
jgi:hypothetical protein